MKKQIVVTGAAGFIASALITALNENAYSDIVLVDDFSRENRKRNYEDKKYTTIVDRKGFFSWLEENSENVDFVFHLGARTDTTEMNKSIFDELNFEYSCKVWKACADYGIGLIYASSAATYGDGAMGYVDNESMMPKLQALNPYGVSKNEFDAWALKQKDQKLCPPFYAGFKFFNVYGPNEYHKERMASVVLHAFKKINETGEMKLFRSHRKEFADGMQSRDFVYVKDVVKVLIYFMDHKKEINSGIFNLGTGTARPFLHLAQAVFMAMGKTEHIEFVDTPLDIRDKYQYYTQADMTKLRKCGYTDNFYTLEEGVRDYVQNYLTKNAIY